MCLWNAPCSCYLFFNINYYLFFEYLVLTGFSFNTCVLKSVTQKLFDTHINPITDDSPDFSFYSLSFNINSLRMNEEDYTQVSPLLDRVETTQTRRSMIIQRICALCCVMFAVLDCEFLDKEKSVYYVPFNKS